VPELPHPLPRQRPLPVPILSRVGRPSQQASGSYLLAAASNYRRLVPRGGVILRGSTARSGQPQQHRPTTAETPPPVRPPPLPVRQLDRATCCPLALGAECGPLTRSSGRPGDDRLHASAPASAPGSLKHQRRKASGHPAGAAPRRAAPSPARQPPSGPTWNLTPLAGPDRREGPGRISGREHARPTGRVLAAANPPPHNSPHTSRKQGNGKYQTPSSRRTPTTSRSTTRTHGTGQPVVADPRLPAQRAFVG